MAGAGAIRSIAGNDNPGSARIGPERVDMAARC